MIYHEGHEEHEGFFNREGRNPHAGGLEREDFWKMKSPASFLTGGWSLFQGAGCLAGSQPDSNCGIGTSGKWGV